MRRWRWPPRRRRARPGLCSKREARVGSRGPRRRPHPKAPRLEQGLIEKPACGRRPGLRVPGAPLGGGARSATVPVPWPWLERTSSRLSESCRGRRVFELLAYGTLFMRRPDARIEQLQELMGHADISTTPAYLHQNASDLEAAVLAQHAARATLAADAHRRRDRARARAQARS